MALMPICIGQTLPVRVSPNRPQRLMGKASSAMKFRPNPRGTITVIGGSQNKETWFVNDLPLTVKGKIIK